jgi:hypothetical protein
VSIAKPVLRFDYLDLSGSLSQAACQVQIDPAANWVSPGFDSGEVDTVDPELDLSTTAYAGLAAGASTQWRVRVQDSAGLWSGWSDAAAFTRAAQGTLTVSNPAAPPNAFVSEWTPPIIWALAGATQTGYRVRVALATNPTHYLLDTGRRTGDDTEYTLPTGVLTDPGATYLLTVDTWDDVAREATPGDPTNVEVQRSFTFAEDPTPNPVTGLAVAADPSGSPFMVLTWSRSTAPDSFSVLRDGHLVESGLDPADLLVSGTSYVYSDQGVASGPHTWTVQAVVNGKTSTGNPSVNGELFLQPIWLTDPHEGLHVPILLTSDTPTFTMPDIAGVYEPPASDHVVRVVQGQRGLEGHIAGVISDYAGQQASHWEANLMKWKLAPQTHLLLMIGNQSIRVIIGNVTIAPLVGSGAFDDRAASFDFWSLDGPA